MTSTIYYLNLQNEHLFSCADKTNGDAHVKNKKIPVGARVLYGDIVSHSFKIAANLSAGELLLKTELKMYEDTGLDPTKTYRFSSIEKSKVSSSETLIEAFAIDKEALFHKYHKAVKKTGHIDFLAIPFLAYETLYKRRVLEPKNDTFVYISEHEAFTASYKEGQYISSKKIKSLDDMTQELGLRNIIIGAKELEAVLVQKGLERTKYDLLQLDLYEYLADTFTDLFSKIKNLTLHNRNVYHFAGLDRIFISCGGKPILNLETHVQSSVDTAAFFTLDFLQTDTIDTLDGICASYIQDKLAAKEHQNNLTVFEKKAPFYQSEIGKFALISAASLVIMSLYPLFLTYQNSTLSEQNAQLSAQEEALTKSSKKYQKEFDALKEESAKVVQEKQEDFKKLQTLQEIANSLLSLKSKDSHYTLMLLKINEALQNYGLKVDKITQADAHALNLELSSKFNTRDTIALLMKDLQSEGFSSVTSNEIILDENDMYKSIVTVKR